MYIFFVFEGGLYYVFVHSSPHLMMCAVCVYIFRIGFSYLLGNHRLNIARKSPFYSFLDSKGNRNHVLAYFSEDILFRTKEEHSPCLEKVDAFGFPAEFSSEPGPWDVTSSSTCGLGPWISTALAQLM